MTASIVSNSTAATFGNSPQKTGEPLDHATLYSGKALEFDGVGDSLSATIPAINHAAEITMACWFKTSATTGGDNQYLPIASTRYNSNTTRTYFGFHQNASTKTFKWAVYDGTDWNASTSVAAESYQDGQWHRVVGTATNGTIVLYIDGVALSDSGAANAYAAVTDETILIGKYSTFYFDGHLCNLQLWDKKWEASDVKYDYENPETLITGNASVTDGITTSNLKLWYPMNDTGVRSPQTVIFDAAGTNITTKNHATTTFLGDELVTNGDCEAAVPTINSQAHTLVQAASFAQSTTVANGGSNSGKVTAASSSAELPEIYYGDGSDIGLTSGRTYRVSVDIYLPGSQELDTIVFRVLANNGSTELVNASTTTTGSWVTLTGDFVDNDISKIRIFGYNTGGSAGDVNDEIFYIDNLTIKEVGIASGWTDADQQDTIPQTALMNGSSKMMFGGDVATGDEYAETATSNDLMPDAANYSFNFWVFLSDYNQALSGAIDDAFLIVPNEFKVFNDGGTLKIYCDGSSSNNVAKSGEFTANGWYHIAVVYDGSLTGNTNRIKLYKNGALLTPSSDAGTVPATLGSTSKKLRIGSDHIWVTHALTGTMDEISMWNASLTDAQVLALYNSGAPLNATKSAAASNLHGYWRNNHLNSDGKWEDLSTNTFHATVTESGTVYSFFQEGISANLDSQGFVTNTRHPSGGAVYFDGVADYMDFGRLISIEGEFAFEFWMKRVATSSWLVIAGFDGSSALYIKSNGVLQARFNDSTYKDFSFTHALHTWQHFVLTRTTGTIKLYLNGSDVSDDETHDGPFEIRYIGVQGTSGYFGGWLDEIRLYNKGLTATQVLKNYKHGESKHEN